MKYLGSIELLEQALSQLKAGQRDLVPQSKLEEVLTLVMQTRCEIAEIPMALIRCDDLIMAIGIALENKYMTMTSLSSELRDGFVGGLKEILAEVCAAAWDWYELEDVPISDETVPLLRTIVSYHYGYVGV